jgi:hypothetical protein
MRRIVKLSLLGLAAGASACSTPDLVSPTEDLPYAGVRFINAVPDTGAAYGLDFRFVDLLESNAHFRITFRNTPSANTAPATDVSTAIQYKGAREGSRHFKVFLDDTLSAAAMTVLSDMTVNLVRGHNYTAMLWGNGRSASTTLAGSGGDKMALSFWEEDVTVTTPGKVKLRVINTTSGALDVWAYTGGTAPATATWPNVAGYSRSPYVEVDSATTYTYQVRTAGAGTNLFASRTAMQGQVATCSGRPTNEYTATNPSGCPINQPADIPSAPGTRVAGSAISGIVFPQSVAGSRAAFFGAPGLTFTWDLRPPSGCSPYC